MKHFKPLVELNLKFFDTQVSTQESLSAEMKVYYSDRLIDNAEPKLVHDQFGDKEPIPAGSGKTVEFRKYSALPKALTKLTEGVTPAGNRLTVTSVEATVDQYGDFIEVSDVLELTAIDRNLEQATKLLGSQAGRTLDTVTREVITAGSNKMFVPSVATDGAETEILMRASITDKCLLRPNDIVDAVSLLEGMNADPIDQYFVGIIHPHVAGDLMKDPDFQKWHVYASPENLYANEIGEIGGVRFVKSTEAKVIAPAEIFGIPGYRRTKLNAAVSSSADIYPVDVFSQAPANATGTKIYVNGVECTVASVTAGEVGTCKITLEEAISAPEGAVVCGFGAGADGSAVYSTMIIGAHSYGVTEVQGGGLRNIIKQLGSAGTADPLNQRATSGWKALKVAERLSEEFMVRIEHSCKRFGKTVVSN